MRLPRFRIRTLMIAVMMAGVLAASWRAVYLRGATRRKVEYCRGGAAAHMALARQFEKELADPNRTPAETAELKLAIKRQWLIARKYAAIAEDPSLPYPAAPFVTSAELAALPDLASSE